MFEGLENLYRPIQAEEKPNFSYNCGGTNSSLLLHEALSKILLGQAASFMNLNEKMNTRICIDT